MLNSMTIRLIYMHLFEPLFLCQMPTRGHLGPNLDFQVNCNISFVLYYKIFRQDLCHFNDTTALVVFVVVVVAGFLDLVGIGFEATHFHHWF